MRIPFCITAALAALSLLLRPAPLPSPKAVTSLPAAGHEAAAPAGTDQAGAPQAAPPATAPGSLPPAASTAPAAPAPAAPAAPAAGTDVLPFGQGMWIWLPERVEGGDANAIVNRAVEMGLTHLYVRTGSAWEGFYAASFLDQILPAAHAAGVRVYGWDFPNLEDINADVLRGLAAITYTTPSGDRIDGFSPDLETPSEGVHLTVEGATTYVNGLRNDVGPTYPLIATVPRPSEWTTGFYPYAEVIAPMSAVAPMMYWMGRDPVSDLQGALVWLSQFGKPLMPIGQAYDGGPEGGPEGNPSFDEVQRFIGASAQLGAAAVSFWSWQHASPDNWLAIQESQPYSLPRVAPRGLVPVTVPPALG